MDGEIWTLEGTEAGGGGVGGIGGVTGGSGFVGLSLPQLATDSVIASIKMGKTERDT